MRVILEQAATEMAAAVEPRLLACDLDGTLLDPQGVVRPAVAAAIGAVRKAGVEVVIATGRSPWDTAAAARELGLTGPQIVMNGGAFMWPDGRHLVWVRRMDAELVLEAIEFARNAGLKPLLGFTDGHACEGGPGLVPDAPEFAIGPRLRIARRIEEMAGQRPVRVYMPTRPDEHEHVLAEIGAWFGDRASIVWGDRNGVEVLSGGTHKGSAVQLLAESLGLAPEQVAAMGDGPNDTAMLQYAGTSAALLPRQDLPIGVAAAAAGARFVVPSSASDGAVEAIRRFFPSLEGRLDAEIGDEETAA